MSNQFLFVVGPPGIGKYTVSKIIADRWPCKLIDNHYWLNPIFGLIQQDGITPIPGEVWAKAKRLRSVVLETIQTCSPKEWNFIFTHTYANTPQGYEIINELFSVTDARSADVLIARLLCDADELAKRVVSPERRLHMKEIDSEAARHNATLPLFEAGPRKMITIDTSKLSAQETAEIILEALSDVSR